MKCSYASWLSQKGDDGVVVVVVVVAVVASTKMPRIPREWHHDDLIHGAPLPQTHQQMTQKSVCRITALIL